MSGLYEEFEGKYADRFFSASWVEVDLKSPEPAKAVVARKELSQLEDELAQINNAIENISQKQLRLSNLSKMYNS